MFSALLVGTGAFIGGLLRYGVAVALARGAANGFPWHTFAVNAVGCLIAGFVAGCLGGKPGTESAQLFVMTGILGGFTTFSAFGVETVGLIRSGSTGTAAIYVFASVAAGLAGAALGMRSIDR
jgi:CrcB protein